MDQTTNMFRQWAALLDRHQTPLTGSGHDWSEDEPGTEIERLRGYIAELEEAYRDYWQVVGCVDVIAELRTRHSVADLFTEDAD